MSPLRLCVASPPPQGLIDTASTCPAGCGHFATAMSYYGMTGLWNTINGYNNETLYPGPTGSGEGWDIGNSGSELPIQGFAVDNNFDYDDVLNWEHGKYIT